MIKDRLCVCCEFSLLDTSSASAFDNKLRRTMTSPYISTTADMPIDSNCRNASSFAYTVVSLVLFHKDCWRVNIYSVPVA